MAIGNWFSNFYTNHFKREKGTGKTDKEKFKSASPRQRQLFAQMQEVTKDKVESVANDLSIAKHRMTNLDRGTLGEMVSIISVMHDTDKELTVISNKLNRVSYTVFQSEKSLEVLKLAETVLKNKKEELNGLLQKSNLTEEELENEILAVIDNDKLINELGEWIASDKSEFLMNKANFIRNLIKSDDKKLQNFDNKLLNAIEIQKYMKKITKYDVNLVENYLEIRKKFPPTDQKKFDEVFFDHIIKLTKEKANNDLKKQNAQIDKQNLKREEKDKFPSRKYEDIRDELFAKLLNVRDRDGLGPIMPIIEVKIKQFADEDAKEGTFIFSDINEDPKKYSIIFSGILKFINKIDDYSNNFDNLTLENREKLALQIHRYFDKKNAYPLPDPLTAKSFDDLRNKMLDELMQLLPEDDPLTAEFDLLKTLATAKYDDLDPEILMNNYLEIRDKLTPDQQNNFDIEFFDRLKQLTHKKSAEIHIQNLKIKKGNAKIPIIKFPFGKFLNDKNKDKLRSVPIIKDVIEVEEKRRTGKVVADKKLARKRSSVVKIPESQFLNKDMAAAATATKDNPPPLKSVEKKPVIHASNKLKLKENILKELNEALKNNTVFDEIKYESPEIFMNKALQYRKLLKIDLQQKRANHVPPKQITEAENQLKQFEKALLDFVNEKKNTEHYMAYFNFLPNKLQTVMNKTVH